MPGNHDCLGDDVSGAIMSGPRVQSALPSRSLHRARQLDGPHNRSWLNGHGSLDDDDLDAIDVALDAAPAGHLVVIALHHHVLPMPEEHAMERLSSWLGFVFTAELPRGRDLLARVRGRCDLVLHGHRHVPRSARLFGPPRPTHIFNAGSSTELARVRVFTHNGAGHLLGGPLWLDVPAPGRTRIRPSPRRPRGRRRRGYQRDATARARRALVQPPICLSASRSRLPASTTRRFERHSIERLTRP